MNIFPEKKQKKKREKRKKKNFESHFGQCCTNYQFQAMIFNKIKHAVIDNINVFQFYKKSQKKLMNNE